ncbi:MAG: hypothetical protein BWY74_03922 [Firmicutes bacterium ADurb.Bin419]|nr:MAG: hypothetical protein BWY74_03922 [Firmicutes bacterium ADurb.Bin419]
MNTTKTYIRNGFATNSSSTHHIIKLKNNEALDRFNQKFPNDENVGEYGWEDFVLSDRLSKARYVCAQFIYVINKNEYGEFEQDKLNKYKTIMSQKLGYSCEELFGHGQIKNTWDFYVDHQSHWEIDFDAIDTIIEGIINNPLVVILGDNDNESERPKSVSMALHNGIEIPAFSASTSVISQKEYSLIFDKRQGTKFRVTSLERSPFPELIDINICDYCDAGCYYCYKDCTSRGGFCEFNDFVDLIHAIYGKTPEIVLGGGEPTAHPRFPEMLRLCHEHGISVGFSTGTLDWIYNHAIASNVFNYATAIACTISGKWNVNYIHSVISHAKNFYSDYRYGSLPKIHFHYIVGLYNKNRFEDFINSVDLPYDTTLVLLAYKKSGRAKFERIQYDWITPLQKRMERDVSFNVAIDNELAGELSADTPFAVETYGQDDGKFSCYYNLMNYHIYKSSHDLDGGFKTMPQYIITGWEKLA